MNKSRDGISRFRHCRPLCMFYQQRVEQHLGNSEIGLPKLFHRLREIRQTA